MRMKIGRMEFWHILLISFCVAAFAVLGFPSLANAFLQPRGQIFTLSPKEYGIVTVEMAAIKASNLPDSMTVAELPFKTLFIINRRQDMIETAENRSVENYEISSFDGALLGWINGKEGLRLGRVPDDVKTIDLATVYYQAGSGLTNRDQTEASERFFFEVLEHYPTRRIPFPDECDDKREIFGEIAAYHGLAYLYFYEKRAYSTALAYYEKITRSPYAEKKDLLQAYYDILTIHREYLNIPRQTTELCHRLIKESPNALLEGFEWCTWIDLEAARLIFTLYYERYRNIERLVQECQKMLEETENPAVELVAVQGIVVGLIEHGEQEEAKQLILEHLKKYPDESYGFCWEAHSCYSCLPAAYGIEAILQKTGDPQQGIQFAEALRVSLQPDTLVDNYLAYRIARLHDLGIANKEETIAAYEAVKEKGFGYDMSPTCATEYNDASGIISHLQNVQPYKATIKTGMILTRKYLCANHETPEYVIPGEEVTVLYAPWYNSMARVRNQSGYWVKIQDKNGAIFWAFDSAFGHPNKIQGFTRLSPGDRYWKMKSADENRTNSLSLEPIENPAILDIITGVYSTEMIFDDTNHDGMLEIISGYTPKGGYEKNLAAIDVNTRELFWKLYDLGFPVVDGDTLYYAGKYVIKAVEKNSGKDIWWKRVYPSTIPLITERFVIVGTKHEKLIAFDKDLHEVVWEKSLNHRIKPILLYYQDMLYVGLFDKSERLVAINANTGEIIWEFNETASAYLSEITMGSGLVYVNGSDGYFYALNALSGMIVWKKKLTEKRIRSTPKPALKGDVIYCTDSYHSLYAIDSQTGETQWVFTISDFVSDTPYTRKYFEGTPVVVNDALYIISMNKGSQKENVPCNYSVLAISLKDGTLLWEIPIQILTDLRKKDYIRFIGLSVAQDLLFVSFEGVAYVIGEKIKMERPVVIP